MSNVTPETLTRAEAHRKLLALGMPADVAADYLDSDASLTARLAVSLACPGAWPILEAYQRHCKNKATTDPIDTVPAEDRTALPVNSIGACLFCDYHGPGPGHDCKPRVARSATGPTVDSGQDIEARAEGACRAFEDAIEPEDMPAHLMVRAAWREVVRYCDSSARAGVDPSALSSDDASLVARAGALADIFVDAAVPANAPDADYRRQTAKAHARTLALPSWLAVVRAVGAIRSVPIAVAADRLASGHVQRLRDGTWEWCHDGGFDNGVVTFSPATNAWLSEVVKDANQPGLTGDVWASLVRAIATLAENDSLVDDAITATERAGCPADVVLHLREINDAMYRRRMRGQSGITWSTAIKAIIALAPHGDVTAQAQTVMRIAGKHQGITEEAIDALHAIAGAMPWHPFTPGMASEALCSFCGKTAGEHVGPTIEDRAYVDIRAERASQIAKGRIPEKDDARSDEDWHACLMGVLDALCNDTRRRWVKVGSVAVAAIQSLDRRAGHGEHDAKRGGQ